MTQTKMPAAQLVAATTSVAGTMSAADKTKLDGIATTVHYPFQARLTLETGVPVSVTDQTAKTTLYLTQYKGDQITTFDGAGVPTTLTLSADISISLAGLGRSQAYTNDPAAGSNIELNMVSTTGFLVGDRVKVSSSAGSEIAIITVVHTDTHLTVDTLALNHTTTTPVVTGELPYDVWVYNNAGTLTLELLAWTNGTTRATALVSQNGVKCKSGDITRRYCGTICTTTTLGQCEISFGMTPTAGGSAPTLYVYNEYNREQVSVMSMDSTDTWAYTSGTIRAKNANRNNSFKFVNGNILTVTANSIEAYTGTASGSTGLGIDSTTINTGLMVAQTAASGEYILSLAATVYKSTVGCHYICELEAGAAGVSFAGDRAGPTVYQTGAIYVTEM